MAAFGFGSELPLNFGGSGGMPARLSVLKGSDLYGTVAQIGQNIGGVEKALTNTFEKVGPLVDAGLVGGAIVKFAETFAGDGPKQEPQKAPQQQYKQQHQLSMALNLGPAGPSNMG